VRQNVRVKKGNAPAPPPLGDWQLPVGYYVPEKMPKVVCHPRPDAETELYDRHRKAYPGLEYRIPIAVQGGAYPFYFEIIEAPAWLSIGQQYGQANYGILHGTPPANAAAQTVRVRVYDQAHGRPDDSYVDALFTLRVTDSTADFMFIDGTVGASGTGAINSPLKSVEEVTDGSQTLTTYPGRAMYIRAGTYQFCSDDNAVNDGRISQRRTHKPNVFIGYPGELPVVDFTNGFALLRDNAGYWWSGIRTINTSMRSMNGTATDGSRFFNVWSANKLTLFENQFHNMQPQPNYSGGNQGIIFSTTALDSPRPYITVWGNSVTEMKTRGFGALFSWWWGVFEDNYFGPTTPANAAGMGIDFKNNCNLMSVRRCTSFENQPTGGTGVLQHYGGPTSYDEPLKAEFCYNLIRLPSEATESGSISFGQSGAYNSLVYQMWCYRNTMIGRSNSFNNQPYAITYEKNVYFTNRVPKYASNNNLTLLDNFDNGFGDAATRLDSEYKLAGAYRTQYLGTHGHEIAGGA
jgi:hypothetical protein